MKGYQHLWICAGKFDQGEWNEYRKDAARASGSGYYFGTRVIESTNEDRTMEQPITIEANGLKCDEEGCGYRNPNVQLQDMSAWIGALCPDCGSPLLTETQYESMQDVLELVGVINSMADDPVIRELMETAANEGNRRAKFSVNCTKDADIEVGELEWIDH